jgi:hypothetical protein
VCVHAGGAVVKSSPGSLWPATRALPRHAVQTYTWAYGECVLPPLYPSFSSPAMVSGHLAMTSEPNSQALLCDAII